MTMDVATTLDPQIAAALAASPIGAIDFGTFTFESLPAMRQAMADMPVVELPPTTTTSREVVVPGATGSRPDGARVLAADRGDRPAVRLLDPRRRLHVRLRPHDRRPRSTAGSRSSTASRCRSSTASPPSTRTRRRSTTATRGCSGPRSTPTSWASTRPGSRVAGASAGGGLAAGLAHPGARPRRGRRSRSSCSSIR